MNQPHPLPSSQSTAWPRHLARLSMIAAVLCFLLQVAYAQLTAGNEYLLNGRGFSGAELTAIEAAFTKAGLGQSVITGNQIRIPRGQKHRYLAAIAESQALPADFHKYMTDHENGDNPFSSTRLKKKKPDWSSTDRAVAAVGIGLLLSGVALATISLFGAVRTNNYDTGVIAVIGLVVNGGVLAFLAWFVFLIRPTLPL